VSTEESFATTLEDVTTDATAYSSGSTYPANAILYWRVRGTDWEGQGLNWSPVETFQRSLPTPSLGSNASGGEMIPALNWSTPAGATGYELHVEKVNGGGVNVKTATPAFTPTESYGVGVWRWQVRALYPGATKGGTNATSAYSSPQRFVRTLAPPANASGLRSGRRLVLSWRAVPAAKQYFVQVSNSNGFAKILEGQHTDNTSWAPAIDDTSRMGRGTLYWRVAAVDGSGNVGSFASGTFGSPKRSCTRHGKHVPCPKPHKGGKHG
jgi:hypothetical protein